MSETNSNIKTANPFITQSLGEQVTPEEQFINEEFGLRSPADFISRYGEDTFNSLLAEKEAVNNIGQQFALSQTRSTSEAIQDTAKNFFGSAVSGPIDASSLLLDIIGLDKAAEVTANASQRVKNFTQSIGSDAEKAMAAVYQAKQQALNNRLDREYKEDIASGKSELEAISERALKEFTGTVSNSLESGHWKQLGSSALGSLAAGGVMTKGMKVAGTLASKIPGVSKAASTVYGAMPATAQKIAKATPWAVNMSALEGGSQYTEMLLEALNMPTEELYVKSPEFVGLVSAYMQQGIDKQDAETYAKRDLAHKAAVQVGLETAAITAPLNYFTSGLAKPFAGGKSVSRIIGDAISELPEETVAEGFGQFASNRAKQKYLDRDQTLMEGVGSSAAEGFVGALGVTGTHIPSATLGTIAEGISAGQKYYQTKKAEAAPEVLKEELNTNEELNTESTNTNAESSSIPKIEDIIVGRGKDTWKDPNVNEVKVGGKDKGSKYEEGTLTRPGTAPDKWNGQKLEDIKDPEGGKALGKFYSSNGSEYVYTDKGYTRRVKFNDSETNGEDAGVNNWRKVLFLDKNDPMYKDFTEGFADKKQLAKDLLALKPALTKDGKIAVFDKATQSWRSLQKSDLYPKRTADGTIKNENYQFKSVDQKPSTDKTLVEFELDDKGFIKNIHFSGGIGYVEGSLKNQDKAIKVAVPKSKESKAKPAKLNVPEIIESFNSAPIPNTPFEYREDGSYIYRDPETNKAYPLFSTEEGKGFTSQDEFYKAALEKVKSFITTDNFILTQGSTTKDIAVANNQFILDNNIYDLSSETQKVFNNPNATDLEKAKALEAEFDGDNFTITPANTQSRNAYDLSPKELQKQGMHIEDGVVKEYDKQEVKDSWSKRFKEKFSKLVSFFIPVKRPIHLWNSDKSPVEVLLSILESKDSFEKFLRLNNFTNASRLANTLWGNKEKLVKQVVSMLSKDSTFMKKFQSQIDAGHFKKPDNCPEAVEEAFYDKDGNPNEKLLEISSIAALHWVALLSAYRHQLTDVEFTRLLQDPKLIASEFDTTGGVVTSAALQNLATSIRKFSGIAFNNKVDAKEAELVFGFIATKVAGALIKANVVETFNVTYQVKEQNKNTGEWKLVDKELQFMKPTADFDKLFRPNAGILLSIIDPTYTNSFHLEPPPVKETVAHSSERITKTQKRVLEIANSKPAKINKLFVQFLAAIGGEEGLADLLEENAQESLRHLYSFKDYQSKQGRAISRRLAFDLIREVLISNPDMTIEEFEIYFSNVVLKNSRIMQEGAATYQSNKLVRQILNYSKNEKHNLTDKDTFRAWRMILAQNLGVKVNARKFENYEKDIDSALSWLQEQVKTDAEYFNLLNKIKSVDARDILNENGKPNELGVTFKKLMDEFNANFKSQKLSLKKEEGFNALLEMLRYAEATKEGKDKTEDLKAFESHIFLEIDGINDGPSYINRLFGVAMGSLSSQFFINNAKTGIFFGVALTSQEAMDDPEVIKFLGTGGKDFHAEVAQEKITGYFLQRVVAFNQRLGEINSKGNKSNNTLEAERALDVIKNTLTFFKAIGWIQLNESYKNRSIEDIVDSLKSIPSDPKDYPFTFDRDISKKLVTIIPYGSQPKGSTEQVLQLGLETFYEEMSNCFMAAASDPTSLGSYNLLSKFEKAWEDKEIVVIDTETTSDKEGPDASKDIALQISVKKIKNGKLLEEKTFLLENPANSGREIQEFFGKEKTDKNRNPFYDYYENNKSKAQKANVVKQELLDFIGSRTIMGHNINSFDIPLLERQFGIKFNNDRLDTLTISRTVLSSKVSKKLSNLVDIAGTAHLADDDTKATIELAANLKTHIKSVKATIEKAFESRKKDNLTMNGVKFSTAMNAIKNLFGYEYTDSGIFNKYEGDIKNLTFSFSNQLPSKEELSDSRWTMPNSSGMLVHEKDKDATTVRNFYIKSAGIEHLTRLLTPIFGEPAQAAVNEVLTTKGMLGAFYPTIISGFLTLLKISLQKIRSKTDKTFNDKYVTEKEINKVGPNYNLSGGAKVVVEKTSYANENEVLYKDPESGLEYRSSQSFVDSSGVSGSPLTTQASGDATTMMELEEILETLGILVGSVHDGFYTGLKDINTVGNAANKASNLAQKQRILKDISKQVERAGKFLQTRGYSDKTNPVEAVKECLIKIAQGKLIDGTNASEDLQEFSKKMQKEILRYLNQVEEATQFESDFFAQRELRKNRDPLGVKTDAKNIETNINNRLSSFFNKFNAILLTEEINQKVLNDIPRTIQHMSGADGQKATYSVGDVLSFKQALDLFKEANKVMKQLNLPVFETWGDLMSAFVNARAKRLYDKKVKAGEIDEKLQKSYEQLNGLDKGNSGTKNELPDEVYKVLADTYFEPADDPSKNKSDFNSRDLNKTAIEKAFDVIKKNVKHPGIYEKFKQVIIKLLPDDIPVKLVSSVAALPKDVRAKFNHTGQLGMYIVTNGKPHIYIVSKNGKLGLDNKQVAETLVHEAIHAVISATIAVYKQDPNKVPTAQRLALKNLENLLKDFLEQAPTIQSGVVQELKNKLESSKSTAEKLDESIAYIMSNIEIFNALSNYRPKKISSFKNEFLHLLRSILGEVYNFIAKLFEITEGSALDKYFKELDNSIPEELNFISLYGANTLVVLGEDVRDPKGGKDKYSAIQDLIRSAYVLPSNNRKIGDVVYNFKDLSKLNPLDAVGKAATLMVKSSYWFKHYTQGEKLKHSELRKDYIKELESIKKYQEVLLNNLRNLVPEDKLDQVTNLALMLQVRGYINPMLKEAINEIYIQTRKQLKEDFLFPNSSNDEEIRQSEGLFNIFRGKVNELNTANKPSTLDPQFQNAALFYAITSVLPEVSEAVGELQITAAKLPPLKDFVNPFKLKEGMEKLSTAIMDSWKQLKFAETESGEVVQIIDGAQDSTRHPTLSKIAQSLDSIFGTLDKSISYVLLSPWLLFGNKNVKNANSALKEALDRPIAVHGFLTNKLRDFSNNYCNVFMSGMIKELYGRTPSNTGVEVFLKKIKGFFDKDRKINLEFLTNKLISEFKNTKVDSKFKQMLHRVIGRSEIVHLSLDEAQKVLTDRKELLSKINSLEGDIKDKYVESTKYMSKALQLAKYLAGTGEAGHNLLTNGDTIGMLFGEPEAKSFRTDVTHNAIHKINRLITLYYLRETMSDADFVKFSEVYSKDSQAINNVIEQLKSAYTREQERSYDNFPEEVNKLYIYNRIHGFLPKGGNARGHYAIVPKSEANNYWKKGYEILGDYVDPKNVKGTPMVRVYTQWPHEREAQEGIFQTITETAVGWEVQRKTRGEATGTKIIEPSIVSNLQISYFTKQVDNVIPIYTTSGALLGFERAIPMSDRNKINENTDLFSAIAQWNVRQTREQEAKNINAEAVAMLYQDWENASEEQKRKQFIDIFNTKDSAIKAAVQRLPGDLVKDIKKKFGGEICWVRKDVVWSYIGYHRMSITDVWDNTTVFHSSLENTIAKILDLIFFNGRGRFYAGNIETVLMGAVTWVRDTIIVRSGIVPIVNALANVLVLHFSLGIPLTKLYQLYKENYNLTMKYNHLTKKKMDLIYQKNLITPVFSDPNHPNNIKRSEIQQEIEDIESIYKNSPIYRLIKEGEYSTISAVGTTYEEIDIGKQKISDWLESRTNKFGEGSTARTAVSEVLMNKSSTGYQLAADFVNLGDWLAKTVAYRYLTEGDNPRGLRLNHDEARNIASILFVDFDQFVSRERDWMNRIGLTWFMTYKYRMVPAALLGVLLNPSRLILGTALSNWTGLGTPFNENLIAKFLSGELGYSVGYEMLWSGATMHPIPTILNTVR